MTIYLGARLPSTKSPMMVLLALRHAGAGGSQCHLPPTESPIAGVLAL